MSKLEVERLERDIVFYHNDFNIKSHFLKACKKAGIKRVAWHTLRHTFASRLVLAGVPITTVSEMMGHSTLEMTMRYSHLIKDDAMSAVEKLSKVS